jgi:riboflavin synthase
MFTGIIEALGQIKAVQHEGSNIRLAMSCPFLQELGVDQSVAHNGICLTITHLNEEQYWVTAVAETLSKTNMGSWAVGDWVNLERALKVGDRLDGHFVQGHVDGIGHCTAVEVLDGSWLYQFSFAPDKAALVIEKGSICINGVSLTVFNVTNNSFQVTIIPCTFEHTTFQYLQVGMAVNLEFDVFGKYILRHTSLLHN